MGKMAFWVCIVIWSGIYAGILSSVPAISEMIAERFNADLSDFRVNALLNTAVNLILSLLFAIGLALIAFIRLGRVDHSRIWVFFMFFALFAGLALGVKNMPSVGIQADLADGWPLIPAIGFIVYLGLRDDSKRPDISGPVPAFARLAVIITGLVITVLSFHVIISALSAIPGIGPKISSVSVVTNPVYNVVNSIASGTGIGGTNLRFLLSALFIGSAGLLWFYEKRRVGEPV
ncbi:MAG: hypothetical protein HKN36_12775 [Hellea sp.]|nr:hypothetical protein [Hellea sp.]